MLIRWYATNYEKKTGEAVHLLSKIKNRLEILRSKIGKLNKQSGIKTDGLFQITGTSHSRKENTYYLYDKRANKNKAVEIPIDQIPSPYIEIFQNAGSPNKYVISGYFNYECVTNGTNQFGATVELEKYRLLTVNEGYRHAREDLDRVIAALKNAENELEEIIPRLESLESLRREVRKSLNKLAQALGVDDVKALQNIEFAQTPKDERLIAVKKYAKQVRELFSEPIPLKTDKSTSYLTHVFGIGNQHLLSNLSFNAFSELDSYEFNAFSRIRKSLVSLDDLIEQFKIQSSSKENTAKFKEHLNKISESVDKLYQALLGIDTVAAAQQAKATPNMVEASAEKTEATSPKANTKDLARFDLPGKTLLPFKLGAQILSNREDTLVAIDGKVFKDRKFQFLQIAARKPSDIRFNVIKPGVVVVGIQIIGESNIPKDWESTESVFSDSAGRLFRVYQLEVGKTGDHILPWVHEHCGVQLLIPVDLE